MVVSMAKSKKKDAKGFILFVLFFAIGIAAGIYGTQEFLDRMAEENKKGEPVVELVEITTKSEYQDLINDLYDSLKGNSEYYKSSGITIDSMSSSFKYGLIYDELISSKKDSTEVLQTTYYGSGVCEYGFLADFSEGTSVVNTCTINKILISDMKDLYKKIFNREDFESVEFYPADTKKCVVVNEYYYCGDVTALTGVTGSLDTRFSIEKVTKDNKGTIYIYDKGYLIDNRSSVVRTEGINNYYLHAADSKDYYFELKSADNYTFKHTFKLAEDGNYYYVQSELAIN